MAKKYFLIPDTETGGLDPKAHKLLEIGAQVFDELGEKVDEFHALLNPSEDPRDQSLYAMKINRCYKRFDSEKSLPSSQVAKNFVTWLLGVSEKYNPTLAGQNLKFDIEHIDEFLKSHGFLNWNEIFGHHYLDTITLAKALEVSDMIKTKKLNLSALAQEFGITNPDAHTALNDVTTTAKVLIHMLNLIKKK